MLLRLYTGLARSVFTKSQEAAYLIAQFRHRLEIW
jgi:hypothetical protein